LALLPGWHFCRVSACRCCQVFTVLLPGWHLQRRSGRACWGREPHSIH
jgi:hypothetical protein